MKVKSFFLEYGQEGDDAQYRNRFENIDGLFVVHIKKDESKPQGFVSGRVFAMGGDVQFLHNLLIDMNLTAVHTFTEMLMQMGMGKAKTAIGVEKLRAVLNDQCDKMIDMVEKGIITQDGTADSDDDASGFPTNA